jgi:cytochrome P450
VLPSPLFARFIPFSGGPRKCVGDQFALLEAIVALAIVIQRMDIQLVADQKINMTTGATIHTTNVRKHAIYIYYAITFSVLLMDQVAFNL